MVNKKMLIDKVGIEYEPMVQQISIPDFTKCIAQFSGLAFQEIPDEIIIEYLSLWCKNKKKYFDLMGEKIRADIPFNYKEQNIDYISKFREIGKEYPVFYPWLEIFKNNKENKISYRSIRYSSYNHLIDDAFDCLVNVEGMSITRFFKQYLKAPDEIVTKIGKIFENNEVKATFTISIDPVDMMLASENPYGWTSCYRLENNNFSDSHADGCLAAVLDTHSLITYVWNNEGKFSLYNNYEFKNIRYKRMRMTIAMSDDFKAIHFNTIYPGKGAYTEDFIKMFRNVIETYVSEKCGFRNMWKQNIDDNYCSRYYYYGYGEYSRNYIYVQSDCQEKHTFDVFDQEIHCPCGCGNVLQGTDDGDSLRYNGNGFTFENFYEEYYCEYTDSYEDCDGDCQNCPIWNRNNPICELDNQTLCDEREIYEIEEDGDADFDRDNIVHCNLERCTQCALFRQHRPEYFKDVMIKHIESETLFVRCNSSWYIKKEDQYYSLWDRRVDSKGYSGASLNEAATYLIDDSYLNNEFELVEIYNDGLDITNYVVPTEFEASTYVSVNTDNTCGVNLFDFNGKWQKITIPSPWRYDSIHGYYNISPDGPTPLQDHAESGQERQ